MERIAYIDYLKAFGIIGVIIIHLTSRYLTNSPVGSSLWLQASVLESLVRFSIIVFVMASGVLLLKKRQLIEDLPRRLKRVLIPYFLWFIVYFFIKMFKEYGISYMMNISNILNFLGAALLDPTILTVQFWFIYMIVGVYIISPVISTWVTAATKREISYFLVIWLFLLTLNMTNINFLLVDYLKFFTGFIGYFILGYYLDITRNKYLMSPKFGLLIFLIGAVMTMVGFITTSYIDGANNYLFIKLGDLTLNAALEATGLFIILKNIDYKKLFKKYEPTITKHITTLSIYSYGIYLANILLINIFYTHGFNINISPFIMVPIFTIITITVLLLILKVFERIPILRKMTGVR